MVMYRSAVEEQSSPQHSPLQISEEELQESDSCTIVSDPVETEESSLLLDSREQIVQQQILIMLLLRILMKMQIT